MILIDTNIFVDHLRGHLPAIKFFNSLSKEENVIFSIITEAELISGKDCENIKRKELTLQFLHRWNKIIISNQIAVLAGDIKRNFDLEMPDAIIAATARVNNADLLTKNIKDFKKVPYLKVKSPY